MSHYKIVISDYYYPNLDEEMKVFAQLGDDVEIVDCTKISEGGIFDSKELIKYAKDCDALIEQFCKIDKEFIDQLENCKVIARYAIGMDTIDVEAAEQRGIACANVPDYSISEVANTAAAHILNGVRKLSRQRDLLFNDEFDFSKVRPLHRTENMTLGLLGFGNIARDLYKKINGFFGKVIAYDPFFSDQEDFPEVAFVSMEEVLEAADVISLHVPLSKKTQNMLSKDEFAQMKDGVVFVNTARGGLVDEEALLAALDSGKVAFAGLDVISTENFVDSPFLHHPSAALTPHGAWCSEEAIVELQRKVAENVVAALKTGQPVYPFKNF